MKKLPSYFTFCCEKLSKIDVFSPDHFMIILWNLLMFLVLMSQIIAIPLKISYEQDYDANPLTYWTLIMIPTIVCVMDMLLRFNTAYYEEGEMVKNR